MRSNKTSLMREEFEIVSFVLIGCGVSLHMIPSWSASASTGSRAKKRDSQMIDNKLKDAGVL